MTGKIKTIVVNMLWDLRRFRARLCACFCIIFVVLLLLGCTQNYKAYSPKGKPEEVFANKVLPDTIYLSDVQDSLQSKPIFLKNRPQPLKVTMPKAFSSRRPDFHPLFPETQLRPPVEVKAQFSTMFRNYSTEEGVAVDVTSCSFADSKGNTLALG